MLHSGGRGLNDNRYVAMPAVEVKAMLGRIRDSGDAGDPNDPNDPPNPNYGANVVGVNAYPLGMDPDLYGRAYAFGMAFVNTPLVNRGSGLPEIPDLAILQSTDPAAGTSLPKSQYNWIRCVFDIPITLPESGNPLVIQDMSNSCADVSNLFTYTIDADDPNGVTLFARENGAQLTNQHWYQVNSAPGWTTVEPFQFELYTQVGDCDASGRVTTADYVCVKDVMNTRDDVREDLDGSNRVTTGDYTVVKDHMNARAPVKPALCPVP